jgi:hypothetical protein
MRVRVTEPRVYLPTPERVLRAQTIRLSIWALKQCVVLATLREHGVDFLSERLR